MDVSLIFDKDKKVISNKIFKTISISSDNINLLNDLPEDLYELQCFNLKLKKLPNLKLKTPNLKELICPGNELTELPELPENLIYLNCNNNHLKKLPELPETLKTLNCNNNELKSLPDLKNVRGCSANNNKISKMPKLTRNIMNLYLKNNNITFIPKEYYYSNVNITLIGNPIGKEIYHIASPDLKLIEHRKYNEEDLPIITIPKGTVLFRNHDNPQVIANDFVGMPKKSFWNGEEYYLSSNHLVWYSLRPFEKMFGDITSINVLQNDIKVILGLNPSTLNGKDIIFYGETKFQIECDKLKHKRKVPQTDGDGTEYACYKEDFIEQNPDIMGSFQNYPGDDATAFSLDKKFILDYETFYEDKDKYINVPELVIYPRKIRDVKDRVMKKKDFTEQWLETHIDEFNVKPLYIFKTNYIMGGKDFTNYKEIVDSLLSSKGYEIDGTTYHMTVNKRDRSFIMKEYADEKTLKHCLPIKKDKLKFLKD